MEHPLRLFQSLQSVVPAGVMSLPSSLLEHLALEPSHKVSERHFLVSWGSVARHRAQTGRPWEAVPKGKTEFLEGD